MGLGNWLRKQMGEFVNDVVRDEGAKALGTPRVGRESDIQRRKLLAAGKKKLKQQKNKP
jgi:hypothetical protein